jgi:hypothetical protein
MVDFKVPQSPERVPIEALDPFCGSEKFVLPGFKFGQRGEDARGRGGLVLIHVRFKYAISGTVSSPVNRSWDKFLPNEGQ